jgi:hypothetical protein
MTDATSVLIDGTPSQAGNFTVEITGTDGPDGNNDPGGNTETITLEYTIVSQSPLIWQDDSTVQITIEDWAGAKNHCDSLLLNGRNNWELPTRSDFENMHFAAATWNNLFFPIPGNTIVTAYWLASDFPTSGLNDADVFVYENTPTPIINVTSEILRITKDARLGVRCVVR